MKSLLASALLISTLAGGASFAATATKTPASTQGHRVAQATTTTTPAKKDSKKKSAAKKTTKTAPSSTAPKTP